MMSEEGTWEGRTLPSSTPPSSLSSSYAFPPPRTCARSPLVRSVDGDSIGTAAPLRHLVWGEGGGGREAEAHKWHRAARGIPGQPASPPRENRPFPRTP